MSDGSFAAFKARLTRRLEIRPYRRGDYAAWKRAWAGLGPTRNEWDSGPRQAKDLTAAVYRRILAKQKKSRDAGLLLILGVFERRGGALVGLAMFENVIRGRLQTANVGYELMNTHWGLGYATEMLGCLRTIAFEDLDLHRVEALINPRNRRSLAVAKRAGMRREGTRKKLHRGPDGEWRDMAVYAATPEDLL